MCENRANPRRPIGRIEGTGRRCRPHWDRKGGPPSPRNAARSIMERSYLRAPDWCVCVCGAAPLLDGNPGGETRKLAPTQNRTGELHNYPIIPEISVSRQKLSSNMIPPPLRQERGHFKVVSVTLRAHHPIGCVGTGTMSFTIRAQHHPTPTPTRGAPIDHERTRPRRQRMAQRRIPQNMDPPWESDPHRGIRGRFQRSAREYFRSVNGCNWARPNSPNLKIWRLPNLPEIWMPGQAPNTRMHVPPQGRRPGHCAFSRENAPLRTKVGE